MILPERVQVLYNAFSGPDQYYPVISHEKWTEMGIYS